MILMSGTKPNTLFCFSGDERLVKMQLSQVTSSVYWHCIPGKEILRQAQERLFSGWVTVQLWHKTTKPQMSCRRILGGRSRTLRFITMMQCKCLLRNMKNNWKHWGKRRGRSWKHCMSSWSVVGNILTPARSWWIQPTSFTRKMTKSLLWR